MADYLREELEKLLDDYDERRRAVLAREEKMKGEDAQFVADFVELRKTVVRPAFEQAAAILAARGHKVSLIEQEFSLDANNKINEAGIFLHVVPAGAQSTVPDEKGRALAISTRYYNKTVWINTGRPAEVSKGSYRMDQISRQFVEEELVRFFAGVVTG
jgi:hypothetical protein